MEAALTEGALLASFEQSLGQPWLAPYRRQGQVLLQALGQSASVAEALNRTLAQRPPIALPGGLLRFVPQAALPAGEAYERFVHRAASVPTRDNAHDLLNGLIWLLWPQLKARLNALHMSQRGDDLRGSTRGPLRDALTVLDENAALLSAPQPLCEALRARDWQRLFVTLRPLWQQARLLPFGHALLEKLMQPRKPICAHVLILPALDEAAVCAALDDADWLARKPFLPLPVLGVPGWWPANESADFYADAQVFRAPRP